MLLSLRGGVVHGDRERTSDLPFAEDYVVFRLGSDEYAQPCGFG
jgi:hypothetical protein